MATTTDRDIDGHILVLQEGLRGHFPNTSDTVVNASFELLSGALNDLNRIANALEFMCTEMRHSGGGLLRESS